MRKVRAAIVNAFIFLGWLLGWLFPGRWRRSRPAIYVRFKLTGDPPYRRARVRRWPWRPRPEPGTVESLTAFERHLRHIADDPQVKGVLLVVEGLRIAASKRDAIAAALDK